MNRLIYILTILFACISTTYAQKSWKHVYRKDGFNIYTRSSKESPIKSLLAEGIINAPVEKICGILRNVESATRWIPNLNERSYVVHTSDTEAILYDISNMPWPVVDRDIVVSHKLTLSKDKKFLILNFKSVVHPKKKKSKKYVRAKIHHSKIEFHPRGNKTYLRLFLLVDPMGKIPKWVVNILQIKMPYEFLKALDKYAQKTKISPLPGVQAIIDQLDR